MQQLMQEMPLGFEPGLHQNGTLKVFEKLRMTSVIDVT